VNLPPSQEVRDEAWRRLHATVEDIRAELAVGEHVFEDGDFHCSRCGTSLAYADRPCGRR
jgi:hypothetical protein